MKRYRQTPPFDRSNAGTDPGLIALLMACYHDARFDAAAREALYRAIFHWEQINVAAPSVTQAYADFQWSLVKYFAKRLAIRFAYFRWRRRLRFRDFSLQQERVSEGMVAYREAELAGWDHVEAALADYPKCTGRTADSESICNAVLESRGLMLSNP